MKLLYYSVGHICLLLGILGIFLPLLPTTPFLLVTAFCYSKASEPFHQWLITHKHLGPPIVRWQEQGAISKKAKWSATALIGLSAGLTLGLASPPTWAAAAMLATLGSVLLFLWTRPNA